MTINLTQAIWTVWLAASAAGCGTSNAVITGIPVGGAAAATGASSSSGAGHAGIPVMSGVSAGIVGGTGVPPSSLATAGTSTTMQVPIAGSYAPAGMSGGAASPPAANGCRASKYSLALRLTIDVRWDETTALMGGVGKAYIWSKLTIDPSASKVSEFRTCGSLLPVLHTTAVAGNMMGFQRAPQAAFDQPTMPTATGGSAIRADSTLTLDPGILLVGLTLPDPAGPWPASSSDRSVMPVDADGDGKPGVTLLVRNDGSFSGPPTSILLTERIDASYSATRLAYRTTLNDAACADTLEGPAELLAIDNIMVGCHVKDRDDCRPEEHKFVEDNRPTFKFGAAVAQAAVIPVDATCAQAVAKLDVAGP
jgi:hypothetical protein